MSEETHTQEEAAPNVTPMTQDQAQTPEPETDYSVIRGQANNLTMTIDQMKGKSSDLDKEINRLTLIAATLHAAADAIGTPTPV